MLQVCLMSDCHRKFSIENFRKESALNVVKINATKTPLKPRLRTSIFDLSPGIRLHRIEQSGIVTHSSLSIPFLHVYGSFVVSTSARLLLHLLNTFRTVFCSINRRQYHKTRETAFTFANSIMG